MEEELEIQEEAQLQKDIREIKKSLNIKQGDYSTRVIAVLVSKKIDANIPLYIPCGEGVPITHNEVYDSVRDGFVCRGVVYMDLGLIPYGYTLELEDTSWSMLVPIPMSVVKRYLCDEVKKEFDRFKSSISDCSVVLLQTSEVY